MHATSRNHVVSYTGPSWAVSNIALCDHALHYSWRAIVISHTLFNIFGNIVPALQCIIQLCEQTLSGDRRSGGDRSREHGEDCGGRCSAAVRETSESRSQLHATSCSRSQSADTDKYMQRRPLWLRMSEWCLFLTFIAQFAAIKSKSKSKVLVILYSAL